ncbi:MAG: ribonuclease R [Bdellovibrionales bacterium]
MMKKKYLQGTIKRHPDGFGFLIPDNREHPDVYIPKHAMKGAMTMDKVMAEVEPEKGSDRFRGEIMRVTSRATKKVMGKLSHMNDQYALLRDESNGWGEDLKIKWSDAKGAKAGEFVEAEIISYPDEDGFKGRVLEVVQNHMDPISDIRRVIVSQQLPHEWPREVEAEASKFSKELSNEELQTELKRRRDLRGKTLITIDGKTAKDFDDAVYVEMNNTGFHLIVAIADVAHYVRVGSNIDKEAYVRGTSVYFPNFVIPMLPEVLSNGLCSLNPHIPRLCMVAEIQYDFTGEKKSHQFYEAVMESKARVTYGEAQEVLDGNDSYFNAEVRDNIKRCGDLAKILMAKRFKEGSLDLEIPETELEIDGTGNPIDVVRSERLFSHRLIEELMLAANVAVAEYFQSRDIPAMYRIHEPPFEDALEILEKFMMTFGSRASLKGGMLQKKLTKALDEFHGKPESNLLNILTLRSMKQAQYSPHNVGHFGLGFENYTHFTSPIRRYPDLIVHRLLKNLVLKNSPYRLMSLEDLESAGTMLSACEQRSAKSERQIKAIKKARFMEKFIDQEFEGMISGVTKFGAFILLREYDIDGLIRLGDLAKEPLEFDEDNLRLSSRRSGLSYTIGDILKIRVTEVSPELGQVNFTLASSPKLTPEQKEKEASKSLKEKTFHPASYKDAFKRNKKKKKGSHKSRSESRDKGKSKKGTNGSQHKKKPNTKNFTKRR